MNEKNEEPQREESENEPGERGEMWNEVGVFSAPDASKHHEAIHEGAEQHRQSHLGRSGTDEVAQQSRAELARGEGQCDESAGKCNPRKTEHGRRSRSHDDTGSLRRNRAQIPKPPDEIILPIFVGQEK